MSFGVTDLVLSPSLALLAMHLLGTGLNPLGSSFPHTQRQDSNCPPGCFHKWVRRVCTA